MMNATNATVEKSALDLNDESLRLAYLYGIPPLIFCCVISLAINIKILMSVYWIRRPLSPTLHISLSLAASDAFSSAISAVGYILNSFIPYGLCVELPELECYTLALETVRMGAIVTTVGHLTALAFNHYLGILKPLHYLLIMTPRIVMLLTIILWVMPSSLFLIYFSIIDDEGFQSPNCDDVTFFHKKKFRTMVSSLFLGPFVLMVFIYAHIFHIVRKHQASRLRYCRAASAFLRSDNTADKQKDNASHNIARNLKAIHTTLLILGSFVIGWMPAATLFVIACDDCLLKPDWITGFPLFFVHNVASYLIVLKTMVNPIIYAARMHEIQVATRRMHASLCGFYNSNTSSNSQERNKKGQSGDGLTSRKGSLSRTAICNVAVNNISSSRDGQQNNKYTYRGIKGFSSNNTVV